MTIARPAVVRIALAALVAVAFAAVDAQSSSAADFRVRSCSLADAPGQPAGSLGWSFMVGLTGASGQDRCPVGGLGFGSVTLSQDAPAWWRFHHGRSIDLVRAEFTITGDPAGAGLRYFVTCAQAQCDWEFPLLIPDGHKTSRTVVTPPVGVRSIALKAICEIESCTGAEVEFGDFLLSFVDDAAPVLPALDWPFKISPPGDWIRPDQIPADFGVADEGFGMGKMTVRFDDRDPPFFRAEGCDHVARHTYFVYVLSLPCGNDALTLPAFRDTGAAARLVEGPHSITATATDSLGNGPTSRTSYFRLDKTPPDPPQDVALSGLEHGVWTSSEDVVASWTNGSESVETGTQSGVIQVWHQLKRSTPEPQALDPSYSGVPSSRNRSNEIRLPHDGLWELWLWLVDRAGNVGGKQRVLVGRDQDSPLPPVIEPGGWLSRDGLAAGRSRAFSQPTDPAVDSGVCGYAVEFNATRDSDPIPEVDETGEHGAFSIPASLPAGENFLHVRAVSCAGIPSATATASVRIDDVRPTVEFTGLPHGDGWSRSAVRTRVVASDDRSRVVGIDCVNSDGSSHSAVGDSLEVELGEGRHTISCWAQDEAGNESELCHRVVNVDTSSPLVRFRANDPADPTLIRAEVDDVLSGPELAKIRLRPLGFESGIWSALPTTSVPDPANPSRTILSARVPDVQLADGEYQIDVFAVDQAGNVVESSKQGVTTTVRVPGRLRRALSTEMALYRSRCGSRRSNMVCRKARVLDLAGARVDRTIEYSNRVAVAGELRDPSGASLPGIEMEVFETPSNTGAKLLGAVTTDEYGRYKMDLRRGPSRRITVAASGTATAMPIAATAALWVRASARLTAQVRGSGGRAVLRLSGRVAGGPTEFPPLGKLVEIQRIARGRAQTVETLRTDASGRFNARLPLRGLNGGRSGLRLRVSVPAEIGWPYEEGHSEVIAVGLKAFVP